MMFFIRPKKHLAQVIEVSIFEGSLFEVWSNGKDGGFHCGFTFLPVKFWRHFFWQNEKWISKHDWNSVGIGIGLVSFFFDYPRQNIE